MNYNETMIEGIAVLAIKTSAAVTASGTTTIGPFNAKTMNRVIFDIFVSAADGTTSAGTPSIQTATTSGATFVSLATGTAQPQLYAPTITSGTTAAQLFRFEYTSEALQQAADVTSGNVGPWVRLLWTGATGTFTWSGVAYGVSDSYPAADIVINPFSTQSTTAVVAATNMYLNGSNINNVPYSATALGNKILPY